MRRPLLPFLAILAAAGPALDCATPRARAPLEGPGGDSSEPPASSKEVPPCPEGMRCKPPPSGPPIRIGLDAALGVAERTSAEAIRNGILIAIEEINAAGGLLGGRPLTLEVRANAADPAQSIANVRELAAIPDLVAVFTGRFGTAAPEAVPAVRQAGIPLLDPGAADGDAADGEPTPSQVFRLSMRDDWAMPAMLGHAQALATRRVGMLLPDDAWGRANLAAAQRLVAADPTIRIAGTQWFGGDDPRFLEKYHALRDAGAQAIVLLATTSDAQALIREVAGLTTRQRLPIISHWRAAEGRLAELAGPALHEVEFAVVQGYTFIDASDEAARRVVAAHDRLFKTSGARTIALPAAVAHAYDLTHILAQAIALARSTSPKAVRDALERLGPHAGLIRTYAPPFTPERHEALAPDVVIMAEYAQDGALEPIRTPRRRMER